MNKIEKEVLSFSKTISKEDIPNLQEKVNEIIKNEEFQKLEPEDKSALIAVLSFRISLAQNECKDNEPRALWRFIRYLTEIEMPMQIIDYSGMLYPNNEKYYSKILTPTAFKVIQQQAQAMIENKVYEDEEHKKWLEKIANGQMPYGYSIELPKKED